MSTPFDPFAALRAMENGHVVESIDDNVDLFSGSEPVDSKPLVESPEPAASGTAVVAPHLNLIMPNTQSPAITLPDTAAAVQMTSEAAIREAVLTLEERVIRLERLALRNGWSI